MPRKTTSGGRSRQSLTRERVVDAAVRLADDAGVEALSMRRLADALGVQAMSLYHHFASKDAILDAMVDLVFTEIEPASGSPWQAALRQRAMSMRRALARHPWAIGVLESRANPGPTSLQHHEALVGCLRGAGFSVVMTAHAMAAIDAYVLGFAVQDHNIPLNEPDQTREVAAPLLTPEAAAAFPNLAWIAAEHVLQPGYAFGDEFEWGLDLVLDGLERRQRDA